MNKRGHVVNAVLLSIGLAVIFEGTMGFPTIHALLVVGIPVTLGALFPDIDTAFGTHRKTFHNFLTLGVFVSFPVFIGNLQYIWIGVLTHYVLDMLGNIRGMALFYPWPAEYDIPIGVNVNSPFADVVTLAVTGVELIVVWAILETDVHLTIMDLIRSLA